jgi:probable rRNA maturation factor
MEITIDNQTGFPLPIDRLETIAESLTKREIELIICDNLTIKKINAEYRSKNTPTDVLSFPIEGDFDTLPLGSIIMSSELIIRKAEELGHTPQEESVLLFIHGLLHLLGYDHEVDDGEMRAREAQLIEAFDLPKSLIVRTEN